MGHAPWSTVFPRLFNDPNVPWLEMFQRGVLDGDIDGALEVAQERFTQIMIEGWFFKTSSACQIKTLFGWRALIPKRSSYLGRPPNSSKWEPSRPFHRRNQTPKQRCQLDLANA